MNAARGDRAERIPAAGGREPLLLSIESSTEYGSVAVGGGGVALAEVGVRARERLSARLIPMATEALRIAGVRREDLEGVVVGAGPGSFTGIRVAAATAKGIARALGVPFHAYSSLLVTAANAWAFRGEVCALADARGRDVFAARYRFGRSIEMLDAPGAVTVDEAIERWAVGAPLFVGSGAVRHRAELERVAGVTVADEAWAVPRASALLWLAARIPEAGCVADPARWQPDYARPSGAERIAAARKTGGGER